MLKSRLAKDKLGMFLSGLCIGHCLLTPLALIAFGTSTAVGVLASEWVHIALYLPMILLVTLSIVPTCVHLQAYRPLVLGVAGILLMTISFGFFGISELLLSLAGASFVFAAHLLNSRAIKRQHCQATSGA
ncbi:MerC domain-containing protein [Aliidiomarina halalkaliphila]|uniref:MerC domain-containing protein n=1 Tax=Aliidiomarina halalkaliphila TaxID=2593535 RepID=A0A552X6I3_9GAMM|nr:MerC domain-containing protein [Aliidiomarina halalkaliphila]TRW50173.1 MerC domain-containing protein [Aliidiomarina halalkaliphila]